MSTIVETTAGQVEGVRDGQHMAFRGIPFAKPPIGARRFLAPEPADPWPGVREAVDFGPSAPQAEARVKLMQVGPQAEDCLYLNVYTPAADTGRRPVLVWIHGGGFPAGSGSQIMYDGGPLVERGDCVVVAINYRLGALGYLYLGERGGEEWGAAPNLGQLDQLAALAWVRDNVAAFGGDPGNVTIAGESAGGVAVGTLLAMPGGKGLFHKASAQSGTAYRVNRADGADELAGLLLDELGLEDARKLRDAPAEAIVRAQGKILAARRDPRAGPAFGPVFGVESLPERPLQLVRDGGAAEIPVVVGTNRDEMKLWQEGSAELAEEKLLRRVARMLGRAEERAPEVVEVYRKSRSGHGLPSANADLFDAIVTDMRFRIPAQRLVEAQRPHQEKTFSYLFCWESPGLKSACHGLEIPFQFGTHARPGVRGFAGTGPAADQLSAHMMDAWTAFMRDGDPSHSALAWEAFETESRPTLVFDERSRLAPAPFDEERAVWEGIVR